MSAFGPLTPGDIPEVMRLERLPGYDAFIGRFTAEQHAAEFASGDARYFGLRDDERLTGFVILQQARQPEIRLRRIAVEAPGAGVGTVLLRGVMDWVFENTAATALTLDVMKTNPRARHVYEREGFAYDRSDEVHDYLAISRRGWATLRGR